MIRLVLRKGPGAQLRREQAALVVPIICQVDYVNLHVRARRAGTGPLVAKRGAKVKEVRVLETELTGKVNQQQR